MSHKSSMHGGGESSDCIVPAKCANKGGEPSAERMEGRRSAKEILEYWADAGHRARQYRQLQYVGSACGPGTGRACLSPRWEPCALEARARVCAGGGGQSSSLPRPAALPGGVALDHANSDKWQRRPKGRRQARRPDPTCWQSHVQTPEAPPRPPAPQHTVRYGS